MFPEVFADRSQVRSEASLRLQSRKWMGSCFTSFRIHMFYLLSLKTWKPQRMGVDCECSLVQLFSSNDTHHHV